MSGRRPLIAVLVALAALILIWIVWPDDISEDVTNNVSPAAADEEIIAGPDRVDPAVAPPDPAPAE